jgi:hypothetical protein
MWCRWANVQGPNGPVALILSGIYFNQDPHVNMLRQPTTVAQVIHTPSVQENKDIIYATMSDQLIIKGTGFVGAKHVKLDFNPPLHAGVTYEIVSPLPPNRDEIVLRLRFGSSWRAEPGPLNLVTIDTGGGPVEFAGKDGIRVADVHADFDLHGVTVETTADEQVDICAYIGYVPLCR